MADLRDEKENPIYLTDQQGKPAQLVDEFGNAMQLRGVATTVPHLKERSYTGPHPITAPITTTDTPYHAQPISVTHNPLEEDHHDGRRSGTSSSTTTEYNGEGARTKSSSGPTLTESDEKKGLFMKIKEKLSGHQHNDP